MRLQKWLHVEQVSTASVDQAQQLQHPPNTLRGPRCRVGHHHTFLDAAASSCLTCSCSASSILSAATGRGAALVRFDLCAAAVLAYTMNTAHAQQSTDVQFGMALANASGPPAAVLASPPAFGTAAVQ